MKEKTLGYPIHIVDVFTDKPLAGNQLAVVLDAGEIAPEIMQRIAREMNFSETAVVMPPSQREHAARVRIFTPATELPYAGHPTVRTAWVLATQGLIAGGGLQFTLEEGVGPVAVRGERGPDRLTFWMIHPPLTFGDVITDRGRVAVAIGLDERDLLPDVPLQVASTGYEFLYIRLGMRRLSTRRFPTKPASLGHSPDASRFRFSRSRRSAPTACTAECSRPSSGSKRIPLLGRGVGRSAPSLSSTASCHARAEYRSPASRGRR